ncbi:DUF397 domain-containing protein [Streptomyces sp. NPDC004237]|uniref:DUF397 domain-containing protein n=1 Tax=Streptomyces sp. NPDC004237 TaxID=3154455 RepID=UPI0033A170A7
MERRLAARTSALSRSSAVAGRTNSARASATWIKSSRSDSEGGDCLEFAPEFTSVVPVRDSENPDGPVIVVDRAAWDAFTSSL